MISFFIGLAILIFGGIAYGAVCQKVFGPDDRKTPAYTHEDGVDFVPMKTWRNSLIQFLNIAGTGPILGPIQGILFGPIAFITIPIGCILGGALHDYFSGMISLRNEGMQMPQLIEKYLGKPTYHLYNLFVSLLMLLVGAVFIYTPGDIFVGNVLKQSTQAGNPIVWVVYAAIFVYYLLATLLPIDKIIGKIYPFFGVLLLISSVLVGVGLFAKRYSLQELSPAALTPAHPQGLHFIPIFFVTVACGIVSGFHSTQSTLIARSVTGERSGRMIFFNMMLLEGFIAMIWAAAAMGIYNKLYPGIWFPEVATLSRYPMPSVPPSPQLVGIITEEVLGVFGSVIALIGIIILPITSGDTALRSLRLMISDYLHIDQRKKRNRLWVAAAIFIPVLAILIFAKLDANGFNVLWRYFAWSNQTISVFAFAMISVYLIRRKKFFPMALIPGSFYVFIVSAYILNAKIGFRLPWTPAYIAAGCLTALYFAAIVAVYFIHRRKPTPHVQSSVHRH